MKSSCLRLHEIEDFKEGKSNHHKQTPYAEGKGIGIENFIHRPRQIYRTPNHGKGDAFGIF